ncbi:hypothetical protein P154DRAFT_418960 [Amniculicola lignicola CBS 123094]|uniref:Uncharacterized protein n=1 Tax=Amniculicola lignicola CBS 123094 TaxID=1392246 RepID=A0A6A5X602_9PLEO|nr:hypothetical protein P154DRAFT_418960 [Amniculicola lignicola CBS 123094]
MSPWFLAFELIRSPIFNRAIHKIYRKVNRLPPMEEQNGLQRTGPSAFDHFRDEVKAQFKELTWQKPPRK